MRVAPIVLAACGLAAGLGFAPAEAQSPPPAGQYELKPVEGGFLRLDRATGRTAFCRPAAEGYACRPTEEGGSAEAALVAALEARVAALEKRVAELGGHPASTEAAKRDPTLDLPSDEQVDRVASFLERALKRLKKLATDIESEPGQL